MFFVVIIAEGLDIFQEIARKIKDINQGNRIQNHQKAGAEAEVQAKVLRARVQAKGFFDFHII